ncbi:uncharacterized protein LOC115634695 isoform X2 [Scaptodrosophila lebanonensis]|uniref:Uncharacterized protein LOC115634695 isoform X2 n=1 Tax=Drosophila lebanonensis TaxID=7225 RepID=A0A6J2UJ63_DROLE|nr:uncharacterized protein LOC115634695 isoform X2 [Scaptodrosophila lebanonensis]
MNMEDIEYLDEYKDLVLPGIKTTTRPSASISAASRMTVRGNARRISSDSSGSSSIDADIFQKLFHGKLIDDELLQEVGSKGRSRLSSSSSDSNDALDALFNRKNTKNKTKKRDRYESFDSLDDLSAVLMRPNSKILSAQKSTTKNVISKKSPTDGGNKPSSSGSIGSTSAKKVGSIKGRPPINSKIITHKISSVVPKRKVSNASSPVASSKIQISQPVKKHNRRSPLNASVHKSVTLVKPQKTASKSSKNVAKKDPLNLLECFGESDDSSYEFESDVYDDNDTDGDEIDPVIDISTDTSLTNSMADDVTPIISEDEVQHSNGDNERLQWYLNNLSSAEAVPRTPTSKKASTKKMRSRKKSISETKPKPKKCGEISAFNEISTLEQVKETKADIVATATLEESSCTPNCKAKSPAIANSSADKTNVNNRLYAADYVDENLTYEKLERMSLDLAEQIMDIGVERAIEFKKRSNSKPRSISKDGASTFSSTQSHIRKLTYSPDKQSRCVNRLSKRRRGRLPKHRGAQNQENLTRGDNNESAEPFDNEKLSVKSDSEIQKRRCGLRQKKRAATIETNADETDIEKIPLGQNDKTLSSDSELKTSSADKFMLKSADESTITELLKVTFQESVSPLSVDLQQDSLEESGSQIIVENSNKESDYKDLSSIENNIDNLAKDTDELVALQKEKSDNKYDQGLEISSAPVISTAMTESEIPAGSLMSNEGTITESPFIYDTKNGEGDPNSRTIEIEPSVSTTLIKKITTEGTDASGLDKLPALPSTEDNNTTLEEHLGDLTTIEIEQPVSLTSIQKITNEEMDASGLDKLSELPITEDLTTLLKLQNQPETLQLTEEQLSPLVQENLSKVEHGLEIDKQSKELKVLDDHNLSEVAILLSKCSEELKTTEEYQEVPIKPALNEFSSLLELNDQSEKQLRPKEAQLNATEEENINVMKSEIKLNMSSKQLKESDAEVSHNPSKITIEKGNSVDDVTADQKLTEEATEFCSGRNMDTLQQDPNKPLKLVTEHDNKFKFNKHPEIPEESAVSVNKESTKTPIKDKSTLNKDVYSEHEKLTENIAEPIVDSLQIVQNNVDKEISKQIVTEKDPAPEVKEDNAKDKLRNKPISHKCNKEGDITHLKTASENSPEVKLDSLHIATTSKDIQLKSKSSEIQLDTPRRTLRDRSVTRLQKFDSNLRIENAVPTQGRESRSSRRLQCTGNETTTREKSARSSKLVDKSPVSGSTDQANLSSKTVIKPVDKMGTRITKIEPTQSLNLLCTADAQQQKSCSRKDMDVMQKGDILEKDTSEVMRTRRSKVVVKEMESEVSKTPTTTETSNINATSDENGKVKQEDHFISTRSRKEVMQTAVSKREKRNKLKDDKETEQKSQKDNQTNISKAKSFAKNQISIKSGKVVDEIENPTILSTPSSTSSTNSCRKLRILVKKTSSDRLPKFFERLETAAKTPTVESGVDIKPNTVDNTADKLNISKEQVSDESTTLGVGLEKVEENTTILIQSENKNVNDNHLEEGELKPNESLSINRPLRENCTDVKNEDRQVEKSELATVHPSRASDYHQSKSKTSPERSIVKSFKNQTTKWALRKRPRVKLRSEEHESPPEMDSIKNDTPETVAQFDYLSLDNPKEITESLIDSKNSNEPNPQNKTDSLSVQLMTHDGAQHQTDSSDNTEKNQMKIDDLKTTETKDEDTAQTSIKICKSTGDEGTETCNVANSEGTTEITGVTANVEQSNHQTHERSLRKRESEATQPDEAKRKQLQARTSSKVQRAIKMSKPIVHAHQSSKMEEFKTNVTKTTTLARRRKQLEEGQTGSKRIKITASCSTLLEHTKSDIREQLEQKPQKTKAVAARAELKGTTAARPTASPVKEPVGHIIDDKSASRKSDGNIDLQTISEPSTSTLRKKPYILQKTESKDAVQIATAMPKKQTENMSIKPKDIIQNTETQKASKDSLGQMQDNFGTPVEAAIDKTHTTSDVSKETPSEKPLPLTINTRKSVPKSEITNKKSSPSAIAGRKAMSSADSAKKPVQPPLSKAMDNEKTANTSLNQNLPIKQPKIITTEVDSKKSSEIPNKSEAPKKPLIQTHLGKFIDLRKSIAHKVNASPPNIKIKTKPTEKSKDTSAKDIPKPITLASKRETSNERLPRALRTGEDTMEATVEKATATTQKQGTSGVNNSDTKSTTLTVATRNTEPLPKDGSNESTLTNIATPQTEIEVITKPDFTTKSSALVEKQQRRSRKADLLQKVDSILTESTSKTTLPISQALNHPPSRKRKAAVAATETVATMPATETAKNAKRVKGRPEQPSPPIAFPVRIMAASLQQKSQGELALTEEKKTNKTEQQQTKPESVVVEQKQLLAADKLTKELYLPPQPLVSKVRKLRVRLNRKIVKNWQKTKTLGRQICRSEPEVTTDNSLKLNIEEMVEHLPSEEVLQQNASGLAAMRQKRYENTTTSSVVRREQVNDSTLLCAPDLLPVGELRPSAPLVAMALAPVPKPVIVPEVKHEKDTSPLTTAAMPSVNTAPDVEQQSTTSLGRPSSCNNSTTSTTTAPVTEVQTFGATKVFSFLYPSRYQRSYGQVGLDFCCPNLDGPMRAIDPTRLHCKAEVPVLELPQFLVVSTKIISKQDQNIPHKVRAKLEHLAAKEGLPCVVQMLGMQSDAVAATASAPSTPAQTSKPAPPTAVPVKPTCQTKVSAPSTLATGSTVTNPMVSTTPPIALTPVAGNIDVRPKQVQRGIVSSLPNRNAMLLQLPPICPTDKVRVELQSRVQLFDLVLQKLSNRVVTLTIAERQSAIEEIVKNSILMPIDVDVGTKLLENYAKYLNISTKKHVSPLRISGRVVPSANNAAGMTGLPVQNRSATPPTAATSNVPAMQSQLSTQSISRPIYGPDRRIIGYQYKKIVSTTMKKGQPTATTPSPASRPQMTAGPVDRISAPTTIVQRTRAPLTPAPASLTSFLQSNGVKNSLVSTPVTRSVDTCPQISNVGTAIPKFPTKMSALLSESNVTPVTAPLSPATPSGSISNPITAATSTPHGGSELYVVHQSPSPEECILPDGVANNNAAAMVPLDSEIKSELEDVPESII